MSYDFSKSLDGGHSSRVSERREEASPAQEVAEATYETRGRTRNWAWAYGTDSYDWMDSHAPFPMSDTFH